MSSQDSKPLLSLKQDSMTGGYKLTLGRVKIPKPIFFDCITSQYLNLKNSLDKLDHIIKIYKHLGLYDIEKEKLQRLNDPLRNKIKILEEERQAIKDIFSTLSKEEKVIKKEQHSNLKIKIEELQKELLEKESNIDELTYDEIIFNGHSLFSILLPNDFEYECINNLSPDKKNVVVIRGVLISGTLNKVAIGSSSGSLIHHIAKDYDYQTACDFVTNYQILICDWLIHHGFTISLSDCITRNTDVIEEEMNKGFLKTVSQLKDEKDERILEAKLINILNKTTEVGQKLSKKALDDDNNIVAVVTSGAKGNEFNITQITGAVGQQNISGERVPKTYGGRTLPHYKKYSQLLNFTERIPEELLKDESVDLIPYLRKMFEARGFVSNSYYQGLNPQEFFFHCAGGREGLIDTAVKSVSWETEILIIENHFPRVVMIGEWIDELLKNTDISKIQRKQEANFELLKLEHPVTIASCDNEGNMCWSELTHVTRHDPGEELFEVTTSSYRKVIVTAAESLLVYDEKEDSIVPRFTKDVKIGDKLPITMNCPAPEEEYKYIDMVKYFPKTEYVYGTEFHKAVNLMNEVMNSELTEGAKNFLKSKGVDVASAKRQKTPAGWWNKVNGKDFVLPYPSKARLQRVMIRSKVENIKEGYIYPYDANREDRWIPEKFPLTYENGVFIGLFIADGNIDISKRKTFTITKEEDSVLDFVKTWLDSFNIKWTENEYIKERGISTEIKGRSAIMTLFLEKVCGHLAHNKHIPDFAYTAPKEFIRGLISGYFSGDGSISQNGIECSSVSRKLIDGIGHLLSRFGIFGKVRVSKTETNNLGTENIRSCYSISIRAQWAKIFKDEFILINKTKNEKLQNLTCSLKHRNYESKNDVVLDPIVSIIPISNKDHPKMYDVTVPKTLNFSIFNNLNIRD